MTFRPDHSQDPKSNFDRVRDALAEVTPLYVDVGFAGSVIGSTVNGNPAKNGQIIHYLANEALGDIWGFRYRAAASSTYKWEWVGGTEVRSIQGASASQSTANISTWTALSNSPSLTVPFDGDYYLGVFGNIYIDTANLTEGRVAVAVNGSTIATHANIIGSNIFDSNTGGSFRKYAGASAGDVFSLVMATNNHSVICGNIRSFEIALRPIRIG